jgi:hypothetical protein
MFQLGLEPTIPVFERAKTAHALDRAVTVIGFLTYNCRCEIKKYLAVVFFIIGGAVLSSYVSVQVPRYLLVPGTAATLAYCTNPHDR